VQVWGADGKLANEVPLVGKGITEGGATTGVFADEQGIYVEREHGAVVRVAGADGTSDPERPELAGRPSRDGRLLLRAAIADRAAGTFVVQAFDRASGAAAWTRTLSVGAPILHLLLLDSDRRGLIYAAAATGRESTEPPYPILDETITVARLDEQGAPRGTLVLPPLPAADETFRPLCVDDDGAIYEMVPTADALEVVRYSF
jgi:hypothetical protein